MISEVAPDAFALSPTAGNLVLLADARFVHGEPDLYGVGSDALLAWLISSRRSGRRKVLNCAFRLGVMARASRELAIIHLAQHAAQRLLGDDDAEFLENPLAEIRDDPPTHDPRESPELGRSR